MFSQESPPPPSESVFIISLDVLVYDQNCPACRLFNMVAQRTRPGTADGYHLRAFLAAPLFGADQAPHSHSAIALAVLPSKRPDTMSLWAYRRYMERGFILAKDRSPAGTHSESQSVVEGSYVHTSVTDYKLMDNWLKHCDTLHSITRVCRREASQLSMPLKCIDCVTRQIRQVDDKHTYFTLSYVWGVNLSTGSLSTGWELDHIPEHTSQVIEDAMQVVKGLGHRYLWVDQYCIDQGNHNAKTTQLAEMDRIYAGAYACIVAGAGSNAEHGLVGVSRPRQRYDRVLTNQLELNPSLTDVRHALKSTTWASRGWTYQEAVLSRRCIFFTEYQIYFICSGMSCSESVMVHARAGVQRTMFESHAATMSAAMFQDKQHDAEKPLLRQLTDHITAYSTRTLTFEEDVLDAFRGLLSRAPFHTFYGIPIAPHDYPTTLPKEDFDYGFARGLWWEPSLNRYGSRKHVTLERRYRFPSWAWAGWKGSVSYRSLHDAPAHPHHGYGNVGKRLPFDTQFRLGETDADTWTLHNMSKHPETNGMVFPEGSHELIIEAKVFLVRFHRLSGRGSASVCTCKVPLLDDPSSPAAHTTDAGVEPVFFEQPGSGTELHERIASRAWHCVLLFETLSNHLNLMIIDWDEDGVAHRIGNLQVHRRHDVPHDFEKSGVRKRIRLR